MAFLSYLGLLEHNLRCVTSEIAAARDYRQSVENEYIYGLWMLDDAVAMYRELKEVGAKLEALEDRRHYLERRIASLKAGEIPRALTS